MGAIEPIVKPAETAEPTPMQEPTQAPVPADAKPVNEPEITE